MKVSLFVLCSLAACNFGRAADCADPRSSQEVAQCLEQSLRSADAHINETYAAVMAKLNVPGQQRLRKDQLGWIRRRDAGCGLDSRNLTQEGWYRLLLTQYDSAVCVTRYTENRSTYLDGLLRSVSTSREAASTKTPTNPPPPENRAAYESISQTGRQTGLWYFELAIWPLAEKVANPLTVAAIWVGCRRPHWHGGATARLIPAETYVPVRVGVALDLNAGKMYLRGEYGWLNDGAPGSSAGIDVKLGQLYRCGVESAMPLQSLLNDQTLDLNYGKHAFYYPIPDGYRPFVEGGT